MPKNEQSSGKTASLAGKTLANPKSTRVERTLAGSVLTQAPDRKAPPPKKK